MVLSYNLFEMSIENNYVLVPDEIIMNKIYLVRDQKVMSDRDLALLNRVGTKVLKQAVKRNTERFPEDFMLEMIKDELENWRSQFVTSKSESIAKTDNDNNTEKLIQIIRFLDHFRR
jgi:hypothetical protein